MKTGRLVYFPCAVTGSKRTIMKTGFLRRSGAHAVLALAALGASGHALAATTNDGKFHPVGETKKAGKAVGHGVKKTTKVVGHGFRDGAKAVGHGARDITRGIGHAFRDGARSLKGNK
jgi:hypothetical protein